MHDQQPAMPELDSAAALAAAFDAEIPADLEAWPMPLVLSPKIVQQHAVARVVRLTLKVASKAGPRGICIEHLKQIYQALQVPVVLADLVERKLTADGVGSVSCGRFYVSASHGAWSRLAAERAN